MVERLNTRGDIKLTNLILLSWCHVSAPCASTDTLSTSVPPMPHANSWYPLGKVLALIQPRVSTLQGAIILPAKKKFLTHWRVPVPRATQCM